MSLKRFNTFEGVFTPSLLSILGVIMYLRLGWVVGQVGLSGALLIIVFANIITLCTAMSMSSIVTNIRIGTGGAHSIIAKSLGIEAGGAVGIPLYLSQAISIAFYITGFSECWITVFPAHNMLLVSLIVWLIILSISYWSAKLAFRLQYVIMAIIGLSLLSAFLGKGNAAVLSSQWANLQPGNFWLVFAVFFPAVTGILAGASMSGELKEPRSSIPKGTLGAIFVSVIIYVALAVWLRYHSSPGELVNNTSIIIDLSRWKWLVVAGILGATVSSALTMCVGSPRTLMALGKHSIIPFSSSFARTNKRGEPTAAILVTALIALLSLFLGTLNNVANVLTMFFLITYGMINLCLFIEQTIGIASFRPSFRIPRLIPFLGSLGCIGIMFLINPTFSVIALFSIVVIYIFLYRRKLRIHSPDVRSGLLIFIAEKLTKAASHLPYHPKIWKPNLLVPVDNMVSLAGVIPFIENVVAPEGRILFFKVVGENEKKEEPKRKLEGMMAPLKEKELFVAASVVEAADFFKGSITVTQLARDMPFPPNTLFYILPDEKDQDVNVVDMLKKGEAEGLGIIVLKLHPQKGFGQEDVVNLWIRTGSPNIDLSVLIALQLKNNWEGRFRLIQVVGKQEEEDEARLYLEKLVKLTRLPVDIAIHVLVGDFRQIILNAPVGDINIFGMPEDPDLDLVRACFDSIQTSVLFLRDSKHESAVA